MRNLKVKLPPRLIYASFKYENRHFKHHHHHHNASSRGEKTFYFSSSVNRLVFSSHPISVQLLCSTCLSLCPWVLIFLSPTGTMSAVPAATLQLANIPQLNEPGAAVHLVDKVLIFHALVAGQSYVLGGRCIVRSGTPLHGPDWPPCKQHHVPAVRVGRRRLKPAQVHMSKEDVSEVNFSARWQRASKG